MTMRILGKWSDGALLETDPRNEDPLFYYSFGNLAHGIGFEVEPLYQHAKSTDVTIGLSPKFLARATALEQPERLTMYVRVFDTLSKRFTRWKRIAIVVDDPLISTPAFRDAVTRLGWSPEGGDSSTIAFIRTSQ